jgi:hypothetical protein
LFFSASARQASAILRTSDDCRHGFLRMVFLPFRKAWL